MSQTQTPLKWVRAWIFLKQAQAQISWKQVRAWTQFHANRNKLELVSIRFKTSPKSNISLGNLQSKNIAWSFSNSFDQQNQKLKLKTHKICVKSPQMIDKKRIHIFSGNWLTNFLSRFSIRSRNCMYSFQLSITQKTYRSEKHMKVKESKYNMSKHGRRFN